MFNLKKTEIYQAVLWEKIPFFRWADFFKKFFLFLGSGVFLSFIILTILSTIFYVPEILLSRLLGFALLGFVFSSGFWYLEAFFEKKLKQPPLKTPLSLALSEPREKNLAQFCDFEAAKGIAKSKGNPNLLLLSFLEINSREIRFVFNRALISRKKLKRKLKKRKKIPEEKVKLSLPEIVIKAGNKAVEKGNQRIKVGDFLSVLAEYDPLFKEELKEVDLKVKDIEDLCFWFERIEKKEKELKKFWEYKNLLKYGAIGRDWAAGYSLVLDKYSRDITWLMQRNRFREIIGHKRELKQIERILSKAEQNNVLLVGRPGTGRTSIIEALAQRAFLGESSPAINYKRILALDLTTLSAEITSKERLEKVLDECFQEVINSGNIILVIEDIHKFLEKDERPEEKIGVINISGILSRYLRFSEFQVIAVTTYNGLHQVVENNPSLLDLFEKVEVSEVSKEETLHLLENYVPFFELKYKRFISYPALKEIVFLADRYIQDLPFPKKALEVLDEAVAWLSQKKKEMILTKSHIRTIVSQRTKLPLEEITEGEKGVLLNLENLLHQRIVDQKRAVRAVSEALRRARADIEQRERPIGTFLFLGPTGVGKTETCKALAEIYFKSQRRMIRLDMSEFQNLKDIERLIGSYNTPGLLTDAVKDNPFSLIVLDELEKAHPNILNLFLQVLDEGHLKDGKGNDINFKNTIIVATSNAGAELIRESIVQEKKMSIIKKDLIDYLLKENIFRPEFINRFDEVVVFRPLSRQDLLLISDLLLSKVKNYLKDKGIEFIITKDLKERIVDLSYAPEFGAREMRRVIQDKVESALARGVLEGVLKRGVYVKVNPQDFSLEIEKP